MNEKKLKTLKDIDSWYYRDKDVYEYDDLRDAAREWIKEILNNFRIHGGKERYEILLKAIDAKDITYCKLLEDKAFYIDDIEIADISSKICWIKHFFNLEK